MAFFNFNKQYWQKSEHRSALIVAMSLGILTTLFALGFMPYRAPLTIYQLMIRAAQRYLEPHLEGLDLQIHRYQEFDFGFQLAWIILGIIGVFWCYFMTHKSELTLPAWLKFFITASAHKAFQIAAIVSFATTSTLAGAFIFFGMKLQELKPTQPAGNFFFQLLEKFNPLYFLKAGWNAFNTLLKAQELFTTINQVNYGLYVACQLAGLLAFMIFFVFVARSLNKQIR
jgi:hypothetical protein